MTSMTEQQIYEIETRKLALDEQREANRAREAQTTARTTSMNPIVVALISAVLGGATSLGGAYFTGAFKVQETEASNRGEADLTKLQFHNQLINNALDEGSDRERALRLQFMVDVGIFDDQLNSDKISDYAAAEIERLDSGGTGWSILPNRLYATGQTGTDASPAQSEE